MVLSHLFFVARVCISSCIVGTAKTAGTRSEHLLHNNKAHWYSDKCDPIIFSAGPISQTTERKKKWTR